jgi:hypothetical protein
MQCVLHGPPLLSAEADENETTKISPQLYRSKVGRKQRWRKSKIICGESSSFLAPLSVSYLVLLTYCSAVVKELMFIGTSIVRKRKKARPGNGSVLSKLKRSYKMNQST